MARLRLYLLGPLRAELDHSPVDIQRRKVWALLVYLAVAGETQRRDTLATLFWPDSGQSEARAALTRHLSELRKISGQDSLTADRETIGLNGDVWLDVNHFQQLVADCAETTPNCLNPLTEAIALYRDDFLTGFTLPDCPDFDEWQFFQTEGLREQFATALERLIQIHSQQHHYEAALPLARRRLALDPLHEPAHQALMRLYALVGQQAAALRQYQLCVQTLKDELGVPPAAETTALYERIRAGKVSQAGPVSSAQMVIAHRFEIANLENDLLGRGGMGNVYRGLDTHSGTTVVIKALRPNVIAGSPDLVERFVREGKALRQLNHPNIVKMVTAVEEEGQHYLVMEYVEGGSLRELLDHEAALPLNQVLEIALDLADALTRAHRLNIIHRDLKPGNILLAQDGTPRLTDFGVAHVGQAERVTETGMVIGTIDYLSPEALNGNAIDARCDIWSFGVLLYEMLAGQRPFAGDTITAIMLAITSQPVPDLAQLRPDLPPAVLNLIGQMLQKDPQQRLASVRLVGAELEAILANPVPSGPVTPIRQSQSGSELKIENRKSEIVNRHNLPAQPTPCIGREAELTALADLIANPEIRLVTIIGYGGMGKTRLALAAAERYIGQPPSNSPRKGEGDKTSAPVGPVLNEVEGGIAGGLFPNGVYFVALAPLSEPETIIPAVAETVGHLFQNDGRSPKQQLLDYFRPKQMLLVLDNFEHLLDQPPSNSPQQGEDAIASLSGEGTEGGLDAVEFVADILQTAPKVKILATSRERLHLHQEQLYPLHGLALPATGSAAVELFLQSARRTRPDFEVAPTDLATLNDICRLVEGMPLGLELAAAWVELLSLADIATEIQQSLDFLETEIRDVPKRHRGMRAVFDASWQRLSEPEQAIFAQLSLFRGGFTRAAAKAVADASLRTLAALANKSLLRYSQQQDRYEIHELLRQYAADKLHRAEKLGNQTFQVSKTWKVLEGDVRDRHAAYYCALLHQRNLDLKGPRPHLTLAELALELDNARIAWNWAMEQGQLERLDQAMDSLGLFYDWQTRLPEGEATFRLTVEKLRVRVSGEGLRILSKLLTWQALCSFEVGQSDLAVQIEQQSLALLDSPELAGQDTRAARAFLLWVMGERMLYFNYEAARLLYVQGLALCRALDDDWGAAHALHALGFVAHRLGAYDEAKRLAEESLAIRQALGDQRGVTKSLSRLGELFVSKGEYEQAEPLSRKALSFFQKIGDQRGNIREVINLSVVLNLKGKYAESQLWLEENLLLFNTVGVSLTLGFGNGVFSVLAVALLHLGQYEQARTHAQQSLTTFREIGFRGLSTTLLTLGLVALAQESSVEAQRLIQESISLSPQQGKPLQFPGPALVFLAYVERALGHHLLAQQHLSEALGTFIEKRNVNNIWNALPIAALLLADQDEPERAVELYALALQKPYVANSRWFEDVAGREIAKIAATLPPQVVAAAEARGRAREVWATAEELLAELETMESSALTDA